MEAVTFYMHSAVHYSLAVETAWQNAFKMKFDVKTQPTFSWLKPSVLILFLLTDVIPLPSSELPYPYLNFCEYKSFYFPSLIENNALFPPVFCRPFQILESKLKYTVF